LVICGRGPAWVNARQPFFSNISGAVEWVSPLIRACPQGNPGQPCRVRPPRTHLDNPHRSRSGSEAQRARTSGAPFPGILSVSERSKALAKFEPLLCFRLVEAYVIDIRKSDGACLPSISPTPRSTTSDVRTSPASKASLTTSMALKARLAKRSCWASRASDRCWLRFARYPGSLRQRWTVERFTLAVFAAAVTVSPERIVWRPHLSTWMSSSPDPRILDHRGFIGRDPSGQGRALVSCQSGLDGTMVS
jgi:hypothetical protein